MLEMLSPSVSAQQTALMALSPSLSAPGQFDGINAQTLFDRCQELLKQGLHSWLILDFSSTQIINSAGIEILTRIAKLARKQELRVLGLNLQPNVELAIRQTGSDAYIEIARHWQSTTFDSLAYWQAIIVDHRNSK